MPLGSNRSLPVIACFGLFVLLALIGAQVRAEALTNSVLLVSRIFDYSLHLRIDMFT